MKSVNFRQSCFTTNLLVKSMSFWRGFGLCFETFTNKIVLKCHGVFYYVPGFKNMTLLIRYLTYQVVWSKKNEKQSTSCLDRTTSEDPIGINEILGCSELVSCLTAMF